jgi:hypothetical protein
MATPELQAPRPKGGRTGEQSQWQNDVQDLDDQRTNARATEGDSRAIRVGLLAPEIK